MIELPPDEFVAVIPLFEMIDHSAAVVFSVLERRHPGQVFVDRRDQPATALLYVQDAFFYAAGAIPVDIQHTLLPVIFDDILPRLDEPEMVLFTFSDTWRTALDAALAEKGAIRIMRKMFAFSEARFMASQTNRAELPAGAVIQPIDAELVRAFPQYQALQDPATRRFGVCLRRGGEILSECTACFVGRGEAEIDIQTREDFRGQGLAFLTAGAFIELCLQKGLTPNWACWPEREASWKLALKLGFTEQPDVPAHLWAPEM